MLTIILIVLGVFFGLNIAIGVAYFCSPTFRELYKKTKLETKRQRALRLAINSFAENLTNHTLSK